MWFTCRGLTRLESFQGVSGRFGSLGALSNAFEARDLYYEARVPDLRKLECWEAAQAPAPGLPDRERPWG